MEGTWRPEHLFELRQARELYRFHHGQITECDQQIEAELAKFANRAGRKLGPVSRVRVAAKAMTSASRRQGPLFQALGVDLTKIQGIDVRTALVILAEIGVDVSGFRSVMHFASCLRLCPTRRMRATRPKARGHRKGKNRIAIALRMAAQSARAEQ